MNSNDIHPIDELFRNELHDFSAPLQHVTMPQQLSTTIGKKTIAKVTLGKLTVVKLTTIGLSLMLVTAVSFYCMRDLDTTESSNKVNNSVVKQPDNATDASILNHSSVERESVVDDSGLTKSPTTANYTSVAEQNNNASMSQSAADTRLNIESPNKQTIEKSQAAAVAVEPTAAVSLDSAKHSALLDTAKNEQQSTDKVVYIKPQQVVVHDTVVRVIKKKRPRN